MQATSLTRGLNVCILTLTLTATAFDLQLPRRLAKSTS